jgi:hypothetical protein
MAAAAGNSAGKVCLRQWRERMLNRIRIGSAMRMRQLVAAILRNRRATVWIYPGEAKVYLHLTPYPVTRGKSGLPAARYRDAKGVAWRLPTNFSIKFPTG